MDELDSSSYLEHMRILEMVEQGLITAAQGSQLLLALQEESTEDKDSKSDSAAEFATPPLVQSSAESPRQGGETSKKHTSPSFDSKFARWRNWWYIPLSFGIFLTIFSGWFLYLGTQNEWAGFWMACIWLPLLFGIFTTVLAWYSHHSLWVHVRVNTGQDEWPRRVAISLPLPLRFGAWFMRTFQKRIPGMPDMDNIPIDEIITAVRKGVRPEAPIYVEVDNGPGQERVEVYIG